MERRILVFKTTERKNFPINFLKNIDEKYAKVIQNCYLGNWSLNSLYATHLSLHINTCRVSHTTLDRYSSKSAIFVTYLKICKG